VIGLDNGVELGCVRHQTSFETASGVWCDIARAVSRGVGEGADAGLSAQKVAEWQTARAG
jgi:hypothetical protein